MADRHRLRWIRSRAFGWLPDGGTRAIHLEPRHWGTAYNRHGKDFCVLHKEGPGLVIQLAEHPYDRVLLSMSDSEAWPLFARLREITAQPSPDGP